MVKQFKLPTYEQWKNNKFEFRTNIGSYHCSIVQCQWSPNGVITYVLSVATNPMPENVYADQVIKQYFEYNINDRNADNKLQQWYNSLQKILNTEWEKYIISTYTCK